MSPQRRSAPQVHSPHSLTSQQQGALRLLRQASDAATVQGLDIWQFAVEIGQLRAAGLSNTDLRCLLCWGYLEHARERTTTSTTQRLFQSLSTLVLPQRTCFVITARGRKIAAETDVKKGTGVGVLGAELSKMPCPRTESPRWDGELRQLWWQDQLLIKEFRRPARNQELVLAALDEQGWPPRMDDPLPQTPEVDPKVRLHDTIKALNRHHVQPIISFQGDGTGAGIRWVIRR